MAVLETIRGQGLVFSGERRNSEAFIRLMKLCRPVGGIDETEELDAWRREKFIHEGLD